MQPETELDEIAESLRSLKAISTETGGKRGTFKTVPHGIQMGPGCKVLLSIF